MLTHEFRQVLDAIQRNLADGNEAADVIHLAFQPAAVVSGYLDIDQWLVTQVRPIFDVDGRAGQHQFVQPVFGIKPMHDHVQHAADHGRVYEMLQRQDALLALPNSTNTSSLRTATMRAVSFVSASNCSCVASASPAASKSSSDAPPSGAFKLGLLVRGQSLADVRWWKTARRGGGHGIGRQRRKRGRFVQHLA